jgi:hypothetical protein
MSCAKHAGFAALRAILVRALFALHLLCSAVATADDAASAPPQVMVMVPAPAAPPADLPSQVEQWRADGLIVRAIRLDAARQEQPAFSTLLILEMPNESALSRWQTLQRLPKDARIRRVAPATQFGDISNAAPDALFEVNAYRIKTSDEQYRRFCNEYIEPLMAGQIEQQLMSAYTMYIERGGTGERWSVLVKAYRDARTYDELVPEAKLAVRARLEAQHPTYPKWHPIKGQYRDDVSETLAARVRE